MRKSLFFLFVVSLALFAGQAHAQRCLPKMEGIRLTAGMADGCYSSSSKNETGYTFGASLATYTKGGHQWVLGAEYLRRYHPYRERRIPVEQFTGEGGFFGNVLSDGSKTFFLSAGISALAGYETVNGGEKGLFDGATLRNKDGFLYGGAVTLQAETYLTDRLVLLLYGRERCLWGGSTRRFHTQYGVGLKIILD
ncbi:conjugal transfer protein TraO [Porphyromonas gingivalis]|uniref:conjugal transfer protein TraO n=1 Tax=Porphyromonas gingivalis TaxID=837 RepID=UPI000974FA54|nr:conjugal transfer protein TraO [Porphyromonas gingivalis]SJL19367.1 conjugative transposon protein TraO [Porphyromonas gingivalis]